MIGRSEETRIKQEHFRKIIPVELNIIKAIIKKYSYSGWPCSKILYVDCNAGSGKYQLTGDEEIIGSPIIFLQEIIYSGLDFNMHLIEQDKKDYSELIQNIQDFLPDSRIHTYCQDNEVVLPTIHPEKNQFGLIYCDPNPGCPHIPAIRHFLEDPNAKYIDWLAYISITGIKRHGWNKCNKCDIWEGSLDRCFEHMKKYFAIRETHGQYQWAFYLGYNDPILNKQFRKLGFKDGLPAIEYFKEKSIVTSQKKTIKHTLNTSVTQGSFEFAESERR